MGLLKYLFKDDLLVYINIDFADHRIIIQVYFIIYIYR